MTTVADTAVPDRTAAAPHDAQATAFDVGLNGKLPLGQLIVFGFQNIFGMIGMFVFPGILGQAMHLPLEQIAYLYGMTFMISGLVTTAQAVWILKLPIVHGPYVGSFTALLTLGAMP